MNITTNGTTPLTVEAGREYVLSAAGTFGGGTLTPKWSDGTNDVNVASSEGDLALSAAAAYVIVAPTALIKLVLAGASGANLIIRLSPLYK